ncbi:MAG: hypothetical protein JO146_04000 [Candidatus Eremiobacteraeota bacterium]|nr:hypothetical protein [Candidatus Eremiobacteraeota bacterium]
MKKAALVYALAAAFLALPVLAQQVSITVNGQPLALSPGPIERTGRVFVPLRGIFERLGATVVYSAGTINATKGSTTVQLRIGSTQATLNGQVQTLDVAPFIVGATTYVPLRFIAQSLGANVGYDNSTRVVSIEMAHGVPVPPPPPRPVPPPPRPPMPGPEVRLRNQRPVPDSEITNRFAVISAEFSREVFADSVRVWIDGANRTMQAGVSSTGFSFRPPAPMDFGSHTVRVAGRSRDGAGFDRSWSFRVAREPISLTINQPAPNAAVPREFTLSGSTAANATVRVTAGASPSSTGQFNGTTTAGPRGNFRLDVSLTTMPGQQTVTVRVTATDPVSLRSTETTLRLRLAP